MAVDERQPLTTAFTREAVDFLDRHREQPFCLCVAYNAVHSPMQATDASLAPFEHIPDIHRRIFAGMLKDLGDSVGDSVRALWDLWRQVDIVADDRYVTHLRGREVSVRTADAQPVQLDGEMGGTTPFTVQVVPSAIRVMIPEGNALP